MENANSLLNHIACASLHRHCMKLVCCSPSLPPMSMLENFLPACSWLHTSTSLQHWSQGARGRAIPDSSILAPLPLKQKSCLNSPVNSNPHHVQWLAFNDERIHVLPCPNEAYKNDSKILEATMHRERLTKRIRNPRSAWWLGSAFWFTRTCQRFWKQPCIADVWAITYASQVSACSFGFGFYFTRTFRRFWKLSCIPDVWANTYAFQVSAWSLGCGLWSQRIMHYPDAMSLIARPLRTTVKTTIDGFR